MRKFGFAAARVAQALVFVWAGAASARDAILFTPFGFVDTSGEPRDQTADHARRLAALEQDIREKLETKGIYRIVVPPGGSLACEKGDDQCILQQARAAGADLVLAGAVQKASSMESNVWMGIFGASDGKQLFFRQATFRGDTDEAWRRAGEFLGREITDGPPQSR